MMDHIPSALGVHGRNTCRWVLFLVVAISVLTLWAGCGDVCLFCEGNDDSQDPCSPDPCVDIANAEAGTCTPVGDSDYTCDCDEDFFWDGDDDACVDPCSGAPCDDKENAVDGSCTGVDANDYSCDCDEGFIWDSNSDSCQEDPCDPDPCAAIENAVEETCTGVGAEEFTCDCDEGFVWEGNACVVGPCDPDPCEDTLFAVPGSCTEAGESDYTCSCDEGYSWNGESNACEEVSTEDCEDLKACLKGCSGLNDSVCQGTCYTQWPGCNCLADFEALLAQCGLTCAFSCADISSKNCWDCVIDCGFDSLCQ
jgi:hypothetical protein